MRTNLGPLCLSPILLLVGSAATAQEVAQQRPRDAIRSAKTFVAGLESPGKCLAKIEADAEQAVGVVVRPDPLPFFLFVPQKDLGKVDFQRKEIGTGYGVPVGYLFGGPVGTPVVGGQLVDWHRMRHTVIEDPKAGKLYFNCLVLTVGRAKDGGLLLHVFGTDEEPLFSMPLEKTEAAATSVEVKDLDVEALRLKLALTFGGQWRGSVPFGAPPRP
jgi:hypothetical protein